MALPDIEIHNWDKIAKDWHKSGLLVGNGASIAVWQSFAYDTLFEAAKDDELANPLSSQDVSLFRESKTTNFERILFDLLVSERTTRALGLEVNLLLRERYDSIRRALFQAVRGIHIQYAAMREENLLKISETLRFYNKVFSTNYDLLVYWAMMKAGTANNGFVDFFWNQEGKFDIADVQPRRSGDTRVYYLHGGIHLYRDQGGKTYKHHSWAGERLLYDVQYIDEVEVTPLLVSEGTSNQKLDSIQNSDYLSFAYGAFGDHQDNLVIFGHSLSSSDDHILSLIRGWQNRKIAISVLSSLPQNAKRAFAGRAIEAFPNASITFFDSASHPLGSTERREIHPQNL